MNNINTNYNPMTFKGLKVNGVVSTENVTKLGEFASRIENINFINYLEKRYETDVVINNEISKMHFSHKIYGDLTEAYGGGEFLLENVFRDVTTVIDNIKKAIKKAEKEWNKELLERTSTKRGC